MMKRKKPVESFGRMDGMLKINRRYFKGVSFHFRDAVEWRFGERQVWSRCDGEGIEMSSQGFEEQIRGCRMDGK